MKFTGVTVQLKWLILLVGIFLQRDGYSQAGSAIVLTINNLHQPTANSFEYDLFVTSTGTNLSLRGYSWGLNMTPGIANGGTITHSFICRDSIFNTIPTVSSAYTAVSIIYEEQQ